VRLVQGNDPRLNIIALRNTSRSAPNERGISYSMKAWSSPEEARAARPAVAAQHHKRQEARHRLTDDFLAEVAAVYRRHVATGKPSKAVAVHFKYTPTSARRVVREARLRGFLGPARPGRGGEHAQGAQEKS
jgi:hypothetical protein